MAYRCGLDWGEGEHAACVLDAADGRVVAQFTVEHTQEGLATLQRRLAALAPAAELPVALERPSGLVVDALLAAGHPVVPIHPNVVQACRSRYRAAHGKSDRGDAYLLADLLRTDGHRFRPLTPCSDAVKALRALVRSRDDLVADRVALTNRLRSLLERFWPGAATLFAALDSPIALAFLRAYPTPGQAARLDEPRLAGFLARQRYPGRRSAGELLERLRAAPQGHAGAAETAALGQAVEAVTGVLASLVAAIAALTAQIEADRGRSRQIEQAVAALPDGQIIMSFPRAGRVCAAQILAELGDVRARFPSEAQLAAEAGVCPVTRASGKRRGVVFRFACNHRLRRAITCFADNSRHASAWAAAIYRRARARGCAHPQAIRILARAWIRVLWRAWVEGQPYNPEAHRAAKLLAPPLRA